MKSMMLKPFNEGLVLTMPKKDGAEGEVSLVTQITIAAGSYLHPSAAKATFDVNMLPPTPPLHYFRKQLGCCGESYQKKGREVKECTWLHFVRFTDNSKDANLACRRHRGSWIFEATDRISPNEILVVHRFGDDDPCDPPTELRVKTEISAEDRDTPLNVSSIKVEGESDAEEEREDEVEVKAEGEVKVEDKVTSKVKVRIKGDVKMDNETSFQDPPEVILARTLRRYLPTNTLRLRMHPAGSLRTPLTTDRDAPSSNEVTLMETSEEQVGGTPLRKGRRWDVPPRPLPESMEEDSDDTSSSGVLDLSRRTVEMDTEPIPSTSTGITHSHMGPMGLHHMATQMGAGRTRRRGGREGPQEKPRRTMRTCDECGLSFDRPSLLERHKRTHTGEKPFKCEVCGKAFSTSSSKNTHVRIHTKEKPHRCPTCGKCFTASSNLYYHKMTHQTTKPYPCTECSKSFPTPGDLRNHSYTHTGDYPVWCRVCRHGFPKQSNLNAHMKTHDAKRKFDCKICKLSFNTAAELRTHMKTHADKRGFVCPKCPTPTFFSSFFEFRVHMKEHYTDDPKERRRCRICREMVEGGGLLLMGLCRKCRVSCPPTSSSSSSTSTSTSHASTSQEPSFTFSDSSSPTSSPSASTATATATCSSSTATSTPCLPSSSKTAPASNRRSSNFSIDRLISQDKRSQGDMAAAEKALDLSFAWPAASTSASSSSEAVVSSHAFGPYPGPSVSRPSPRVSPGAAIAPPSGSPSAGLISSNQSFFARALGIRLPTSSGSSPPIPQHSLTPFVAPSPFLALNPPDLQMMSPRYHVPGGFSSLLYPYVPSTSPIHFTGVFHYTGLRPWGSDASNGSPAPILKMSGRPPGPCNLPM